MKLNRLRVPLLVALFSIPLLLTTTACSESSGDEPEVENNSDEPIVPVENSYYVTSIAEFDAAVAKAEPGDEIVLANGEWEDTAFVFDTDGVEGNMIYLRAENAGKVILTGNSTLKIAGDYLYVYNLCFTGCVATSSSSKNHIVQFRLSSSDEANHSVISDCHFDACVPTDKSFDDVWIGLYGTYNTIQRCYMGDKDSMGLYIVVWHDSADADYHTIKDNYFYRPKTYNNLENGQEIIRIGDSSNSRSDSNTVVENNFFYQCNGEIEIISIKSGDNLISQNTFYECGGCVTLRHGDGNTIESNYFLANSVEYSGGIRVINADHLIYNNYFYKLDNSDSRAAISLQNGLVDSALNGYYQVENVIIANNTFAECKRNFAYCIVSSSATLTPSNVTISNALVITSTESRNNLIDTNNGDVSGISYENCYMEAKDGVYTSLEGLLSQASYTTEQITIGNITFPKYTASTTASTPSFVGDDISGVVRSSNSAIGAIVDASAAGVDVATPDNCGPNWSGWYKPL